MSLDNARKASQKDKFLKIFTKILASDSDNARSFRKNLFPSKIWTVSNSLWLQSCDSFFVRNLLLNETNFSWKVNDDLIADSMLEKKKTFLLVQTAIKLLSCFSAVRLFVENLRRNMKKREISKNTRRAREASHHALMTKFVFQIMLLVRAKLREDWDWILFVFCSTCLLYELSNWLRKWY